MKEIITAYFLDLIIGDPHWIPHPVRIIGKVIKYLERVLRKNNQGQQAEKIIGNYPDRYNCWFRLLYYLFSHLYSWDYKSRAKVCLFFFFYFYHPLH